MKGKTREANKGECVFKKEKKKKTTEVIHEHNDTIFFFFCKTEFSSVC